jgi:hypothetical protein
MSNHMLPALALAIAIPLAAQDAARCASGPQLFGITGLDVPSISMLNPGSPRPIYSFRAEPVVTQVDRETLVAIGDAIEAVDGRPITTQAGADAFMYPTAGPHSVSVRRGRERQTLQLTLRAPCVDGPTGGRGDDGIRAGRGEGRGSSGATTIVGNGQIRFEARSNSTDSGSVRFKARSYPTPFNPQTRFPFAVGDDSSCAGDSRQHVVSMEIMNALAQVVAVPTFDGVAPGGAEASSVPRGTPISKISLPCGRYIAYWNGTDQNSNKEAASGVYVFQLFIDGNRPVTARTRASRGAGSNSAGGQGFGRGVPVIGGDPLIVIDGVVQPPRNSAPQTGRFGFAVECRPSCSRKQGTDGEYYYKYDGYPRIVEVREQSAAAKAGLRVGDLLTKVEGRSILEDGVLQRLEQRDQLHVTVERDGKAIDAVLVVAGRD